MPVTLSSELIPEIKEYERTSTTVVNAYVLPTVRRYLHRLKKELGARRITTPLGIMQSNGGVILAEFRGRAAVQHHRIGDPPPGWSGQPSSPASPATRTS